LPSLLLSSHFSYFPSSRADLRKTGIKLLIDEETGQGFDFEELKQRTDALSIGFRKELGVGESNYQSFPTKVDRPGT